MRYSSDRKNPGNIADAYSFTTDCPATAAYTMIITEGGMRMPSVPPAVITPEASRTS